MGDMTAPEQSEARRRLALLIEERATGLDLTWNQLAKKARLTKEGLRGVRFGSGRMRRLTKAGLESALRWEPGSIDAVLAGGDPTPSPQRVPLETAYETDQAGEIGRRVTDEDVLASGLSPETKAELLEMRELVARWIDAGDEQTVRRAARVVRALDDEQDVG